MRRLATAVSCLAAASLWSAEAAADKFDETFDVALTQAVAWFQSDDTALEPALGAEPPAALRATRPRLVGNGSAAITRARALLSLDGLRFGAGLGFLVAGGNSLRHDGVGDGASLDSGVLWGIPLEGFIGYAHGSATDLRPYLELYGGLTILQTTLILTPTGAGPDEASDFAAYLPTVGARSGALLPLSEYYTLDLALSYAALGPERISLWLGLLLPIPLANL